MSRGRWWSTHEDETILRLRDVSQLNWKAIAAKVPGRSAAACEQRYYGKLQGARNRAPRPTGPAPKPGPRGYWRRPVVVNVPLAAKPAKLPPPPFVPRGRVATTEALRDAALLQARIETCGDLTRGYFGDPEPGRSALDQRAKGAPAAVERPFSIAVSDG
ncbi:SANT/Myb-like DNA-binding domain-containing protein [Bradyrhizobium barranii]|uniref:SANT/Myb-like DNA-binding domain-containing protein n=1 Tax=Bradyrhizobium TaxID=374 RepID=UPI003F292B2D